MVTAMPGLCDSTDFGLEDVEFNHKLYIDLLKGRKTRIDTIDAQRALYRTGSKTAGTFFVAHEVIEQLVYFMKYEAVKSKIFGTRSVTQVAVWKALSSGLPIGFAGHMIFTRLLNEYGVIMSYSLQTTEGRKLWLNLLSLALGKPGYEVGLADSSVNHFFPIKTEEELMQWTDEKSMTHAWAPNSARHEAMRFVIALSGRLKVKT